MDIKRRKRQIGDRYLSFGLMDEVYCIEIRRVKELMGMKDITPVPNVPAFIIGVINLRGQIISIVDLRLKLGMPFNHYSRKTGIIIVEMSGNRDTSLVGIAVDSIQDVIDIPADTIAPVNYLSATVKTEYIRGVAAGDAGMKIILDIEKVLERSTQ